MYNKYQQMNNFLEIWRDIAIENPNINFLEKEQMIYRQLTRLNVSMEDRTIEVNDSYFPAWIKRFYQDKNINCFVNPE